MYVMRRWSTRNARMLEAVYDVFARAFHTFDPLWHRLGLDRLEKPFAVLEAWGKGFMFDCNMCGRCLLSVNGMTCPMNCPKQIRNGPCGGVRANGTCEVRPRMACVWVEAWSGAQTMRRRSAFHRVQPPGQHRIRGTSAWLRLSAENVSAKKAATQNTHREPAE